LLALAVVPACADEVVELVVDGDWLIEDLSERIDGA